MKRDIKEPASLGNWTKIKSETFRNLFIGIYTPVNNVMTLQGEYLPDLLHTQLRKIKTDDSRL